MDPHPPWHYEDDLLCGFLEGADLREKPEWEVSSSTTPERTPHSCTRSRMGE